MYPASAPAAGCSACHRGNRLCARRERIGERPPRKVPVDTMPVVLFVWGLGRILPVRVTTLTLTEKLYDVSLNPPTSRRNSGSAC